MISEGLSCDSTAMLPPALGISVSIYNKEGKEQEVSAETPIWIDPLNEADFRVEFPDLESKKLENLGSCDHEDAAPTECISWGVTDVMGLAL